MNNPHITDTYGESLIVGQTVRVYAYDQSVTLARVEGLALDGTTLRYTQGRDEGQLVVVDLESDPPRLVSGPSRRFHAIISVGKEQPT